MNLDYKCFHIYRNGEARLLNLNTKQIFIFSDLKIYINLRHFKLSPIKSYFLGQTLSDYPDIYSIYWISNK